MSTSQNNDNPYAAPHPVEPETIVHSKVKDWGCFSVGILILAAPPFLFCLASPLLLEFREGWQHARALLFVAGYVGMFFRREWAYTIVFVVAVSWMAQIVYHIEHATPNPDEPGLVVIFAHFYAGFAIYSAIIALFGAILALSSWLKPKSETS